MRGGAHVKALDGPGRALKESIGSHGFHVGFLLLSLLLLVLADQQYLILIEMLEDEIVVEELFLHVANEARLRVVSSSWLCPFSTWSLVRSALVAVLVVEFLVELLGPLLDIIKSIKSIHELDHALGILFLLGEVALDEEGQRQEVEDVLIQLVGSVMAEV